jgi:hypothetical protein
MLGKQSDFFIYMRLEAENVAKVSIYTSREPENVAESENI